MRGGKTAPTCPMNIGTRHWNALDFGKTAILGMKGSSGSPDGSQIRKPINGENVKRIRIVISQASMTANSEALPPLPPRKKVRRYLFLLIVGSKRRNTSLRALPEIMVHVRQPTVHGLHETLRNCTLKGRSAGDPIGQPRACQSSYARTVISA